MRFIPASYLEPLVTFDRLINRALGGTFSETLSSRAHRMRLAGKPRLAYRIDRLFFWQDCHCLRSYERWHTKA